MGTSVVSDNNRYIKAIAQQTDQGDPFTTAVIANIDDYTAEGDHFNWSYFRYWHGWQFLTNLCLMFADIEFIGVLSGVLAFIASLLLFLELKKRLGGIPSVLLVSILFLIIGVNFAADILLEISFATLEFCGALILFVGRKIQQVSRFSQRFWVSLMIFIAGCIYCFIDFYTLPSLAIAFIVFCATVVCASHYKTFRNYLGDFTIFTCAFLCGFSFTWVFKWVLAASVLGAAYVFENVLGEVGLWTLSSGSLSVDRLRWLFDAAPRLYALCGSAYLYLINPAGLVSAVLAIVLIVKECISKKKHPAASYESTDFIAGDLCVAPRSLQQAMLLCLPVLFVPIYCVLAYSHTVEHAIIFSFKLWSIVFGVISCSFASLDIFWHSGSAKTEEANGKQRHESHSVC